LIPEPDTPSFANLHGDALWLPFGSRRTPIERRKAVDQEPAAAFPIDRDTPPVAPRIVQRKRSDQVVAMGLRAVWMKIFIIIYW
jgi:hypothetical protein